MRPVVAVIAIMIGILLIPSPIATANPIPVPNSGGDPPPPDSSFNIIFRSERVIYTINNEEDAEISALYVLFNPNNEPVSLNISLPFDGNVPENLRLGANGRTVDFETIRRDSLRDSEYSYARFNLGFSACETLNLRATYSLRYSVYSDWSGALSLGTGKPSYQHFWCRYIAITGRYWHNSLDSAEFQFRVKKDLYGSGLDGFIKTEESGYIVATQKYTNWTPNENIEARWERPDIGMTVLAHWVPILVIVWVISIFAVIIVFRQRRMKKQARRAWRGP